MRNENTGVKGIRVNRYLNFLFDENIYIFEMKGEVD